MFLSGLYVCACVPIIVNTVTFKSIRHIFSKFTVSMHFGTTHERFKFGDHKVKNFSVTVEYIMLEGALSRVVNTISRKSTKLIFTKLSATVGYETEVNASILTVLVTVQGHVVIQYATCCKQYFEGGGIQYSTSHVEVRVSRAGFKGAQGARAPHQQGAPHQTLHNLFSVQSTLVTVAYIRLMHY